MKVTVSVCHSVCVCVCVCACVCVCVCERERVLHHLTQETNCAVHHYQVKWENTVSSRMAGYQPVHDQLSSTQGCFV